MDEITLRSTTGYETTAAAAVWVKCLIEMLPPAQMGELVQRVQAFQGSGLVLPSAGAKHYRMLAEPGRIGLRRGR